MIPRILDMLFLSAPHLAGDDVRQRSEERRRYRFYPRHPHGWRRTTSKECQIPFRFYPRHPRGWRRFFALWMCYSPIVSIHATLAGGDISLLKSGWTTVVSIHATLAGGDAASRPRSRAYALFLSTPPSRVATCFLAVPQRHNRVSIHATLTGGDPTR